MTGDDTLWDPQSIYASSFAQVREATDLSTIPEELRAVALRLVHACGEPTILDGLQASSGAAGIGSQALRDGATVLVDSRMVADGITRRRLPADSRILCTLNLGQVAGNAKLLGITRSAAAVKLWQPWLGGGVVVIGNAPTALFALLEGVNEGWPRPALVIGMPVGFVGAADAKAALAASDLDFITLTGIRGGSALAAAALNALASEDS
ncbi:MAG: precorrin-8X methylmutase [Alphaproteobacteria bacterium]